MNKRKYLLLLVISLIAACGAHQSSPVMSNHALDQYFSAWRGTPYLNGGASARGLDCSAFVQNAYRDVFHLTLPRSTRQQIKFGKRVRRSGLQRGDLVFFKTGWRQRHVGIYTKNDKFIHASLSNGVMESSLNDDYWNKRYWKARRIL